MAGKTCCRPVWPSWRRRVMAATAPVPQFRLQPSRATAAALLSPFSLVAASWGQLHKQDTLPHSLTAFPQHVCPPLSLHLNLVRAPTKTFDRRIGQRKTVHRRGSRGGEAMADGAGDPGSNTTGSVGSCLLRPAIEVADVDVDAAEAGE